MGLVPASLCIAQEAKHLHAGEGLRWLKGNTHTHTYWSDGDAAPEVSVAWYKDHGYDFLCLSDHNVLSDGSVEKWVPVTEKGPLTQERLEKLQDQFGKDSCMVEVRDGTPHLKLKTLPELREKFEEEEKFLLIQAEEITSFFPKVHMNGINLKRVIPPANNKEGYEVMISAIENLEHQSQEFGMPVFAHLNHPNWGDGVTAEDIMGAPVLRFFEVYNGHPGVRNWGNEERGMPSTDRIWDIVLAHRMRNGEAALLGVASDDTHNYHDLRIGEANAGRGWVMVLASKLEPNTIVEAMKRGDFYSSSGVGLQDIGWTGKELRVEIEEQQGVDYKVQFIGTRRDFDVSSEPVLDEKGEPKYGATRIYSHDIGEVLFETDSNPAVYPLTGDELYVRAKVISNKLQDNPFAKGDYETAWTQPYQPPRD
jgi:hypothetical protein